MLLRVRSNVGLWRVDCLDEATCTVSDVLDGIARTRPHVIYEKPLSADPSCAQPLDAVLTLAEQKIRHGSMIHCRVDPSTCVEVTPTTTTSPTSEATSESSAAGGGGGGGGGGASKNMRRVIDRDGTIKLVPCSDARGPGEDRGFRKGMMPLRDMKMQWTLTDFVALDAQFEFKMRRQETAVCGRVSLDVPSIGNFQSYLQRFQFQRKRYGHLYGRFVRQTDGEKDDDDDDDDDAPMSDSTTTTTTAAKGDGKGKKTGKPTKVLVEAIYEPPQEVDHEAAEGWVSIDDEEEEQRVERVTTLLGLTKVGWIYGHGPRRKGFVMTAAEVIMTAEQQLESAGGVEETPFVTVKVAPSSPTANDAAAANAPVSVEAFQVSQQCMAMVAEEALEVGTDETVCVVNETFTAIQEGKASPTVENNFFLTVVPIVQHTSDAYVSEFPRLHRDLDDAPPSHDALKRQLSKAGTNGWTFEDLLSDLNLLLYLDKFMDPVDMEKICSALVEKRPIEDGYKLLIKSMAGMDGAY